MLGLTAFLARRPGGGARRATCWPGWPNGLCERYRDEATADWRWFEPTLDLRQRPLAAGAVARARADARSGKPRVARESLEFLEETCFQTIAWSWSGTPAGTAAAAHSPEADEQPIDAAAFVLAFRGAYLATRDHRYLRRMREAFAWFLGANRLGAPSTTSATAGCRDGLGESAPNLNQGAESTISFLLSLHRDAGARRRRSRARDPSQAGTHGRWSDARRIGSTHDPSRVIAKPYLPGEEIFTDTGPRAGLLMERVLALPEEEVAPRAGRHPRPSSRGGTAGSRSCSSDISRWSPTTSRRA